MPEWIAVVCLGIIEGITEFLPVSSTGHLKLAEHWLTPTSGTFNTAQSDVFNTVVQCGAVLAVILTFARRLKQFAFQWREPATQDYLLKLLTAFVITGVGGLVLKKLHYKLTPDVAPVAVATLVGGVLFLIVERWLRNRALSEEITWQIAVAAAAAQLLAVVFPGASRSGMTILAALALGCSRPAATEFSFLLGIPTLLSAGALQTLSALRHPEGPGIDWGLIALGSAVGAVTAFGVVKWLVRFVQTHTFVGFAWYRIVLGTLLLVMML